MLNEIRHTVYVAPSCYKNRTLRISLCFCSICVSLHCVSLHGNETGTFLSATVFAKDYWAKNCHIYLIYIDIYTALRNFGSSKTILIQTQFKQPGHHNL